MLHLLALRQSPSISSDLSPQSSLRSHLRLFMIQILFWQRNWKLRRNNIDIIICYSCVSRKRHSDIFSICFEVHKYNKKCIFIAIAHIVWTHLARKTKQRNRNRKNRMQSRLPVSNFKFLYPLIQYAPIKVTIKSLTDGTNGHNPEFFLPKHNLFSFFISLMFSTQNANI